GTVGTDPKGQREPTSQLPPPHVGETPLRRPPTVARQPAAPDGSGGGSPEGAAPPVSRSLPGGGVTMAAADGAMLEERSGQPSPADQSVARPLGPYQVAVINARLNSPAKKLR